MPVRRIETPDDPRIEVFGSLADPDALAAHGLIAVEGRVVVERLLRESAIVPEAVIVTDAAHRALQRVLDEADPALPVWVVPRAWMEPLTGFNLHRGCVALARRPAPSRVGDLLAARPRRLLVLEGVGNPDNVGGLFRSARALGVEGVVLGPGSGDPLYRKAIRVSCGAALVVPFARAGEWPGTLDLLRRHGLRVVALTPDPAAPPLTAVAGAYAREPLALLVGAEGAGLSKAALAAADERMRIEMDPAADSLNVGVAAAIALHALRARETRLR